VLILRVGYNKHATEHNKRFYNLRILP